MSLSFYCGTFIQQLYTHNNTEADNAATVAAAVAALLYIDYMCGRNLWGMGTKDSCPSIATSGE